MLAATQTTVSGHLPVPRKTQFRSANQQRGNFQLSNGIGKPLILSRGAGAGVGGVEAPVTWQLPVTSLDPDLDRELHDHAENDNSTTHLKRDIRDIGNRLNNFNNDLYHVLFELVNNQSAGFANSLYNLKARDYNAALPDRTWNIKALKNPDTGKFIAKLFEFGEGKGKTLTVEQLEGLSNPDKEEILNSLGMDKDFNLILEDIKPLMAGTDVNIPGGGGESNIPGGGGENNIPGGGGENNIPGGGGENNIPGGGGENNIPGGGGENNIPGGGGENNIPGEGGENNIPGGVGENNIPGGGEFNIPRAARLSGQVKDSLVVTNDNTIKLYLQKLDPADRVVFLKKYNTYLKMQLRIAVGLSRAYCDCPPGV